MTTRKGVLLAIATLTLAFSCTRAQDRESNLSGTDEASDSSQAQSKLDLKADAENRYGNDATADVNSCVDQPCTTNDECCKGFTCSLDPERSRVQHYCLAM